MIFSLGSDITKATSISQSAIERAVERVITV